MPGSGPRRSLSVPRRFGVVLAFILAGAAACTTPPGADDGPPAGPGGTIPSSLRIALTSSGSLDPAELDTPESQLIADQIFDGLVGYDPGTGAVVPAVAETWDVRDGGRRFVFRLRGDATFHDGSPVTADRFVFAWNRLADPGRAAPFAFLLESIAGYRAFHAELEAPSLTGVRAANPRTLEVQLTRPWPDFIAVLGHPALSPLPASAEDAGFALQPVGNGPYRVATQAVPGSPVTLERHDAYHGPPAVVPNVVFAFHGTPEEAWPRFLSGDLDIAPIPADVVPEARARFGEGGLEPLGRVLSCGLNQRIRKLRDPALAEAVALGIDREALVDSVYGELALVATGLVPPPIPGYRRDACGPRCSRDLGRARALVSTLSGDERRLTLDFSDSAVGQQLASALASQLDEVGLSVRPRPHDDESFATLIRDGRQELFCFVWVGDYPRQQAFLEPLLRSDSPDNHTRLEDARIDRILERARAEPDPTAREERYRQVERLALQRAPLFPIAWFRSRLAVQDYVGGFVLDPLGGFDVSHLSIGR